jgi:hypothetical protein
MAFQFQTRSRQGQFDHSPFQNSPSGKTPNFTVVFDKIQMGMVGSHMSFVNGVSDSIDALR